MKKLSWYIRKELLIKDNTAERLSGGYLEKARANLITMELLSKATAFRKSLALPEDYCPDEWVVITAYYAMYMAALACLAKLGYRSKNHAATIAALEEFIVKKKLLERKYLEALNKIKLKKEEIENLNIVRDRREIAQYSVTKETTREIVEKTKKDARKFVDRFEELLDLL